MARLRNAGRVWRSAAASVAAGRAFVNHAGAVVDFNPVRIFDRNAPLEIELGAGRGDFILERAAAFPERDFLAVELAASVGQLLAARVGRAELKNLKVARMDARTLVNLLVPDGAVSVYHIYFPDPWPKERHAKHRLFTPFLCASLRRSLAGDGLVHVASDVGEYFERISAMMAESGMRRVSDEAPGAARTGFGLRFLAAGRPAFAATFAAGVSPQAGRISTR